MAAGIEGCILSAAVTRCTGVMHRGVSPSCRFMVVMSVGDARRSVVRRGIRRVGDADAAATQREEHRGPES
jgi:hypothetical protein